MEMPTRWRDKCLKINDEQRVMPAACMPAAILGNMSPMAPA